MSNLDDLKNALYKYENTLIDVARKIWENPELFFEEYFATKTLLDVLKENDCVITENYCDLPTAFKAEYGTGDVVMAFAAEYDALPVVDHGCGHNLIAASSLGAFLAIKDIIKEQKIDGKVILFGTPAEESGGGKLKMLQKNCLDGVGAIVMAHPSWRTCVDTGSTSIRRFEVEYFGKAAHAAASPELGINALDGVNLLFTGVNAWRQALPENTRVHGIIVSGGDRANIIPDYAMCRFYLRSTDDSFMDAMESRFKDIAKGAALMTGATVKVNDYLVPYKARKPNNIFNQNYFEVAKELGLNPQIPKRGGRGSSDFGDFSQVIPGSHLYFGISDHGEIPGHSIEMNQAANSQFALDAMLKTSVAIAHCAYRYLTENEFRQDVHDDFNA